MFLTSMADTLPCFKHNISLKQARKSVWGEKKMFCFVLDINLLKSYIFL